jgi:hypothetical protein
MCIPYNCRAIRHLRKKKKKNTVAGEGRKKNREEENDQECSVSNLPAEMLIVLGWQKSGSVVVEKWWHGARLGDLVSEMWAPWVC